LPGSGISQERAIDEEFKYSNLNTITRMLSRMDWPSPAGCESAAGLEETWFGLPKASSKGLAWWCRSCKRAGDRGSHEHLP